MKWLDVLFANGTREIAHHAGRRSALAKIAGIVVSTAFVLPVLPFDRTANAAEGSAKKNSKANDDTSCDYWRYCAIDGFLCTCCGGSITSCPPGTEVSTVSWIGTCHNPNDGRDYLISYNDCCGVTPCGKCACNNNVGDKPGYRLGAHNDINWCMANQSSSYHCTVVAAVGIVEKEG